MGALHCVFCKLDCVVAYFALYLQLHYNIFIIHEGFVALVVGLIVVQSVISYCAISTSKHIFIEINYKYCDKSKSSQLP